MVELGTYCKYDEEYEIMEKYYLMAIELGNSDAMTKLGSHYRNRIDYVTM